jgi:hypothetical protein
MSKKPLITVSILLKGYGLNPDYISETLGIQPTESQKKGEKRGGVRPNSKAYVTKTGTWWFSVDNKSRPAGKPFYEVPQLVDEVLQMFAGRKKPLDAMAGVDEAYLDILIIQDMEDELDNTAEFILRKDQIVRIGQLGLGVCNDASFNDDRSVTESREGKIT